MKMLFVKIGRIGYIGDCWRGLVKRDSMKLENFVDSLELP